MHNDQPPDPENCGEIEGTPDPQPVDPGFPVVGVGASAGGLEAFQQLIEALPPDTGMAFVFVQHLSPDQPSHLPELLQRATSMEVLAAEDNQRIEPNRLYIIPPDKGLTVEAGRLHLAPRPPRGIHMPIDILFESLAQAAGPKAIGVVLSGTGSDGTRGLAAIQAAGGLTFAQAENSAAFSEMPRQAIRFGAVDHVLLPRQIAEEIVRIGKHPLVTPVRRERKPRESSQQQEIVMRKIFRILWTACNLDFNQYKPGTIQRRINRRMVLLRMRSLQQYAEYLRTHPREGAALCQDLLITVTKFFREPANFDALTRQFRNTLRGRKRSDPIRAWVVGCATGEEAYSIAICIAEALQDLSLHIPFQIFGTDVNEAALERARSGVYPESISADVTPQRLRRYFSRVENGYRIANSIRECCVFARQDITKDPPFSKIDIVTCRNVLIYLNTATQHRVLRVLRYSLNPGGLLMLGSAEAIGADSDLFASIDKEHQIYVPKAAVSEYTREPAKPETEAEVPLGDAAQMTRADLQREADRILRNRYSPDGIIVDENLDILQFRGQTSFYLTPDAEDTDRICFVRPPKTSAPPCAEPFNRRQNPAFLPGKPASMLNIGARSGR